MKLLVFSHKEVWRSSASPSGWATDGGFVFHMAAVGSLFDEVEIWVPEIKPRSQGEVHFKDPNLKIRPIKLPIEAKGVLQKGIVLLWGLWNYSKIKKAIRSASLVHTPIPSDIGTIGMVLTLRMRKPLFIRHCGNWKNERTLAERFWKKLMVKHAGDNVLALTTGGGIEAPSRENANIKWIFSSSLLQEEINAYSNTISMPKMANRFRLITVSRQVKLKGTDTLLKAMALIQDDAITLEIVGDGNALEENRALAKQLDLNERVTFHGKLDNIQVMEQLSKADLFCYPTRSSEGFPKVILEAMANGLPVITTNVSVLPTLVGKSGAGMILDSPSPEMLAAAIIQLKDDPERLSVFSANALIEAKKYSLESWAQEIGMHLTRTFHQEYWIKRPIQK